MDSKRMCRTFTAAGAYAFLMGTAFAADKEVQRSEVPAAVKAVIEERLKGATPSEIEVEEENGRQVYSIEFMRDGKEVEIEVAADGEFLGEEVEDDNDDGRDDDDDTTGSASRDDDDHGTNNDDEADDEDEQKIDPASAPKAVKSALKSLLNGATIKTMTKESDDGKVVYEAEFAASDTGVMTSVEIAQDGTLLETEEAVAMDAVPAAVRDAVKKRYPAGSVKEAEKVTEKTSAGDKQFYELNVQVEGKTFEIKVEESGNILETEDDD